MVNEFLTLIPLIYKHPFYIQFLTFSHKQKCHSTDKLLERLNKLFELRKPKTLLETRLKGLKVSSYLNELLTECTLKVFHYFIYE